MKATKRIIVAIALIGLLFTVSGCDSIFAGLFGKITVKFTTYDTSIWTIKVRETGTTAWTEVTMKDEDGNTLYSVSGWDSTRPDTAYFDLPSAGEYDIAVYDVLGTEMDKLEGVDASLEIDTDYDYLMYLSSNDVLSFY